MQTQKEKPKSKAVAVEEERVTKGTASGIWECGIHTTKLRIGDNKGIKALATKAEGETAGS